MNHRSIIGAGLGVMLGLTAAANAATDRIAIIETKGDIGEDLTLGAFKKATDAAKAADVETLVFVLDSTGGNQQDARLIAESVRDAASDLHIVVCVRRALGEAVWLMASGEQLLFAPAGASGAAVAYRVNPQSGAAEVDRSRIAAVAAQVGAIAEANRQPAAVYRAMIDPAQSLWTVEGTGGRLTYHNTQPPPDQAAREWDNPATVLALTPDQAVTLGLGTHSGDRPADIAAALGYTDFVVINDPNRQFILAGRAAAQARAKYARESAQATRHVKDFDDEYGRFTALNTNIRYQRPRLSPYVDRYDARDREYYNQFLNEVGRYRRALEEVQHAIGRAADMEQRAAKAAKEATRQAETLNELIGYARYSPVAAEVNAANKAAMETAWRTIQDELAWCAQ